jgi:hypothetical protein
MARAKCNYILVSAVAYAYNEHIRFDWRAQPIGLTLKNSCIADLEAESSQYQKKNLT